MALSLGMHRIPYGKDGPSQTKRPAIFLAHALVCNSAEFVFGPPNKSLGYILADAGKNWNTLGYQINVQQTLQFFEKFSTSSNL